jgi:7-carboxy-7-deazaguanine synthase
MSEGLPILQGEGEAPSAPRPARGADGENARDRLPISETFVSIQGEGKLTGVPSLFIRTSGCNLRCRWCDTPYASWSPDGGQRTIDSLVEEARAAAAKGVRHAVVTGGEPMMFAQTTELTRRLAQAEAEGGAGMHITIETAGTIMPEGGVTCHLMSISPKLGNSTPINDARDPDGAWAKRHEERRTNHAVLQRLLDECPERQLKFVLSGLGDIVEIDAMLRMIRGWNPGDILLMPEGTPPTAERRDAAVQLCMQRGWRYCHRVHLDLFGNVRGT